MKGFNWDFDFNPHFPIHIFPFTVCGNRDSIHWYYYLEIGLCTGGHGKFVYLNHIYPAEKGDIFFSGNYESHVAISEEGKETQYLFLIFLPSFIAPLESNPLNHAYLSAFNFNPLSLKNRIEAGTPPAKRIRSWMQEAYLVYTKRPPQYQLRLDVLLRRILLEIAQSYTAQDEDLDEIEQQQVCHSKIMMAQEYINNHFMQKISVSEVAEQLKLNPSYFRHLFKEVLQVSFTNYVTYLRLSQAKKMLLATDKSISEVLHTAGWGNANQFYRVFQQNTGMTPAAYRRRFCSDQETETAPV
jgi:AraC-like DNA-binding protein